MDDEVVARPEQASAAKQVEHQAAVRVASFEVG
jgi:hypothetical protein